MTCNFRVIWDKAPNLGGCPIQVSVIQWVPTHSKGFTDQNDVEETELEVEVMEDIKELRKKKFINWVTTSYSTWDFLISQESPYYRQSHNRGY